MALISTIEAALRTGLRVETLDYLCKKCPKAGQNLTLKPIQSDLGPMFDEAALESYLE